MTIDTSPQSRTRGADEGDGDMSCTSDKACPPDTHYLHCSFPSCAYGIKKAATRVSPESYTAGFKAGAEAMRERAAKAVEYLIQSVRVQGDYEVGEIAGLTDAHNTIRALPVEE